MFLMFIVLISLEVCKGGEVEWRRRRDTETGYPRLRVSFTAVLSPTGEWGDVV